MILVAFGHEAGVGKDTATRFMLDEMNKNVPNHQNLVGIHTSFAKELKNVARTMYGWAGLMPGFWYEEFGNRKYKDIPLPKIGKTPREIWIELGESARRISDKTWAELMLQGLAYRANVKYCVISDLRHYSELEYVTQSKGWAIKITNSRAKRATDVVDRALDDYNDWSGRIANDGDMNHFREQVIVATNLILAGERGWVL